MTHSLPKPLPAPVYRPTALVHYAPGAMARRTEERAAA